MQKIYVDTIIFDMDGVITDTMPYHYRAWRFILNKEGAFVTKADIYSREGQRGIHSIREIFEKYDIPYSPHHGLEILRKKEEQFKKIVKKRFISGARSLLKYFYRQKFKLGLVTGTSRHEVYKVLPDHLLRLFSVIITSNDVNQGKPYPEPYLLALKKLNTSAGKAIVIENAPFGILSAKKAKIRCIALETSLSRDYLAQADMVFHSIREMRQQIKLINKN